MLRKIGRIYDSFENGFSCITLLAGVSIIFINVVGRFVFNHPLAWADEVYLIILAWSIIVGFSIDMREKSHIDMDVIYNLVSPKIQKAIELFNYLCGLLYGIFIAWYGYQAVALQYKIGRVYPITEFPRWISYVIIVFIGIMIVIRQITFVARFFSAGKEDGKEEQV